jgi:hypothetical protein
MANQRARHGRGECVVFVFRQSICAAPVMRTLGVTECEDSMAALSE